MNSALQTWARAQYSLADMIVFRMSAYSYLPPHELVDNIRKYCEDIMRENYHPITSIDDCPECGPNVVNGKCAQPAMH